MPMTDVIFLYVTAPNAETAARIARALIEEKHAACVNIHGEVRSVYEWEGKVEIKLETPLIVKTSKAAAERAKARIMKLHPYDEPCIVALEIADNGSSAGFLDWIVSTTNA